MWTVLCGGALRKFNASGSSSEEKEKRRKRKNRRRKNRRRKNRRRKNRRRKNRRKQTRAGKERRKMMTKKKKKRKQHLNRKELGRLTTMRIRMDRTPPRRNQLPEVREICFWFSIWCSPYFLKSVVDGLWFMFNYFFQTQRSSRFGEKCFKESSESNSAKQRQKQKRQKRTKVKVRNLWFQRLLLKRNLRRQSLQKACSLKRVWNLKCLKKPWHVKLLRCLKRCLQKQNQSLKALRLLRTVFRLNLILVLFCFHFCRMNRLHLQWKNPLQKQKASKKRLRNPPRRTAGKTGGSARTVRICCLGCFLGLVHPCRKSSQKKCQSHVALRLLLSIPSCVFCIWGWLFCMMFVQCKLHKFQSSSEAYSCGWKKARREVPKKNKEWRPRGLAQKASLLKEMRAEGVPAAMELVDSDIDWGLGGGKKACLDVSCIISHYIILHHLALHQWYKNLIIVWPAVHARSYFVRAAPSSLWSVRKRKKSAIVLFQHPHTLWTTPTYKRMALYINLIKSNILRPTWAISCTTLVIPADQKSSGLRHFLARCAAKGCCGMRPDYQQESFEQMSKTAGSWRIWTETHVSIHSIPFLFIFHKSVSLMLECSGQY